MKKIICIFFALTIGIIGMSGCNQSESNPFASERAVKGQIGNLYYAVPYNATADEKNDNNIMYSVPIENSVENYQLGFVYGYISEDESTEDEAKNGFEMILNNITSQYENLESKGLLYESEQITDFLGVDVDAGIKYTAEYEGQKVIGIAALISRKMYLVTYQAKTSFFEQSVWDNFYAQLELV